MKIRLNGAIEELPEGLSVAELLQRMGLHPARVAVERNGEIVRRNRHADMRLQDGDEIEVVTMYAGG